MKDLFNEIKNIKNMQMEALSSDTKVNEKLDSIQRSLEPMKEELSKHSSAIVQLDFEKRRRNIIIFGLQDKPDESFQDLEHAILRLINNTLELRDFSLLELDFARRLKTQPNGKPRPVLLGFTTQRRKIAVLKSRGKLKGTKIYMNEDASPQVREKEKALYDDVAELRKQGKYAFVRAGKIIAYDKKITPENPYSRTPKKVPKRAHSESPNTSQNNSKRHATTPFQSEKNSVTYHTDSDEFENTLMYSSTSTPLKNLTPSPLLLQPEEAAKTT